MKGYKGVAGEPGKIIIKDGTQEGPNKTVSLSIIEFFGRYFSLFCFAHVVEVDHACKIPSGVYSN